MWSGIRHVLLAYVLPGLALLAGGGVCVLGFSRSQNAVDVPIPGALATPLLLLLAVLAGVLAQLTGSLLTRGFRSHEDVVLSGAHGAATLPAALVQAARERMALRVGVPPDDLTPLWLFRLCNIEVRHRVPHPAIPPYRGIEALHLGLAVAALPLAAGLALIALRGGASFVLADRALSIPPLVAAFLSLAALTYAPLLLRASLRYARLRVRHAVLTFLLLPHAGQGDSKAPDGVTPSTAPQPSPELGLDMPNPLPVPDVTVRNPRRPLH